MTELRLRPSISFKKPAKALTNVPAKSKSKSTKLALAEMPDKVSLDFSVEEYALVSELLKIRDYVNGRVYERERETEGLIVAILSGTSALFVGAPGAGKTFQTRIISKLFGMSVFDTLMSETTKPDSIFGPTDVPALANGIQRTKIKGYAPDCEILFFDEIFKASGVVLNPLLWLINEHEYRNGDEGIIQCPTKAVFAASNELPTDDALAAIFDRFLLRYQVSYLKSRNSLNSMLDGSDDDMSDAPTLESTDIEKLRAMTKRVVVPADVRETVYTVRDMLLRSLGIQISDRRLVQSFKILRAKALLEGRSTVIKEDIEILSNVFWSNFEQCAKARSLVLSMVNSKLSDIVAYAEVAETLWQDSIKSGELDVAKLKMEAMLANVEKFSSNEGKQIAASLLDYLGRIDNILNQRKTFTILILPAEGNSFIFQVGRGTDSLWSSKQLRKCGFRHARKANYWWQEAYDDKNSMKERKSARISLRKTVSDALGVTVEFNKI